MSKDKGGLDRQRALRALRRRTGFDVIVIGGGAAGLGVALDAASRGLSVALFDGQDFGAGTSSRTTKLLSGGLRFLPDPRRWPLLWRLTRERRELCRNAPSLIREQRLVVPCYSWAALITFALALGVYAILSGAGLGRCGLRLLSPVGTLCAIPGVRRKSLKGGVSFTEMAFDDAALALSLAHAASSLGAVCLNYCPVIGLELDESGRIARVSVRDEETGQTFTLRAKTVFNCAGAWVDGVRRLADRECEDLVRVARGSHIVVPREFMPTDAGLLIARRPGSRPVFILPWRDQLLIGHTMVAQGQAPFDPEPTSDEIDELIAAANTCLTTKISRSDVRAAYAGLRSIFIGKVVPGGPAAPGGRAQDRAIVAEFGNLITVHISSWVSCRAAAEEALTLARAMGLVEAGGSRTSWIPLPADRERADALERALDREADIAPLSDQLRAFALHCLREEGARKPADILYRRLSLGFLNRRRAEELTPLVRETIERAAAR